jgi:hypothetical protein
VGLLVGALARYLEHWPRIWDVLLWDETHHLGSGLFNWFGPPRYFEAQALYALFYKAVASACDSSVETFFLVGLIDVVAATVGLFVAVWMLSRSVFLATVVAAILIGSDALLVTPRALFPAIAVLSLGSALSLRQRDALSRSSGAALTLLVVAFLRPEFVLAFYLVGAAALAWGVRFLVSELPKRSGAELLRSAPVPLGCLAAGLLCLVGLGLRLPIPHTASRSYLAFGQAFAWRWSQAHPGGAEGGLIWDRVLAKVLPGADSLLAAVWMYPGQILGFFAQNLEEAPRETRRLLEHAWQFSSGFSVILFGALLAWIAIGVGGRAHRKPLPPPVRQTALRGELALLLLAALGPALAVLLIFPRRHYLLVLASCLVLLLARLSRPLRPIPLDAPLGALVACALLLSIHPAPVVEQPTLGTIRALERHVGIHRMLEAGHGWCAYLVQPCERYAAFDFPAGSPLRDLLDADRIDSIVVTPELLDLAGARGDVDFLALLLSPQPAGWTRYELSGQIALLRRR